MEYSKDSQNITELLVHLRFKTSSEVLSSFISKLTEEMIDEEKNSLSLIPFHNFFGLPLIITQKLFNSFGSTVSQNLSVERFINGITQLYSLEDSDKTLNLFFKLFDFDNDGIIHHQDVLLLAYHFHFLTKQSSLDSLERIIIKGLPLQDMISYDDFIHHMKTINGDIIYLFLVFFIKNKPFQEDSIKYYQKKIYKKTKSKTHCNEEAINGINRNFQIKGPSEGLFNYLNNALGTSLCFYEDIKESYSNENNSSTSIDELDELIAFEDDIVNIKDRFSQGPVTSSKSPLENIKENNFYSNPVITKQRYSAYFDYQKLSSDFKLSQPNITQFRAKTIHHESPSKFKANIYCVINEKMMKMKLTLVDNIAFVKEPSEQGKHSTYQLYLIRNILEISTDHAIYDDITYFQVFVFMNIQDRPSKLTMNFTNEKDREIFIDKIIRVTGFTKIRDVYEFSQEIGSGNFGLVFFGHEKFTKEKVAIKVIVKDSNDTTTYKRSEQIIEQLSIRWEVDISRLLSRITNENIIKVLDVYETVHHIYIVMEYVPSTLSEYLHELQNENTVNQQVLKLSILSQTITAITFLHKMGIIHRDIKIENLVINKGANGPIVKVIDFGFAKVIGSKETLDEIYGTLCYMSPETVSGKRYGLKEDIWALGILGYYFLKGTMPFSIKNRDMDYLVKKITNMKIMLNDQDYDSEQEKVIVKMINHCLEHSSDLRYDINQLAALIS